MKRYLAAVALATLAVVGASATAQACPAKPHVTGVVRCERALVKAHAGTVTEDAAMATCTRLVRTEAGAKRVTTWASKPGHRWALAILGQ